MTGEEDFRNFPDNLFQYSTLLKASKQSLIRSPFMQQKFITSSISHMPENFLEATFHIFEDFLHVS